MENTENQVFENDTLEDTTPEPIVDTDNLSDESSSKEGQDVNEAAIWQDKYVRLSAEFDNYRKRTLKEKADLIQNGGADVLKSVISTADDFERALNNMGESADKEGVKLIYNKFMETLRSKGIVEIEAIGKPFDVDYQEAIAKVPVADEAQKGVVIDVVQKGYMLRERVLRFAKVVVGE